MDQSQRRVFVKMQDEYTTNKIKESIIKVNSKHSITQKETGTPQMEWTITDTKSQANMQWIEYEEIDWSSLTPSIGVCSYVIRKGLIRKAQNALLLDMYVRKRPLTYLSTPLTVLFTLDCLDYLDEAMNEAFEIRDGLARNEVILSGTGACGLDGGDQEKILVFMMKPSICNRASGIFVFRTRDEFSEILGKLFPSDSSSDDVEDSEDEGLSGIREWVVQEFIDTPLLLNNRKFHIRTYVLAIGALEVYVFDQMLALFSLLPYLPLSSPSLHPFDPLRHITNTCIQSSHPSFREEESVCSFWDIGDLEMGIEMAREMKRSVFKKICLGVHDLFDAVLHSPTSFQPMPNAFELYGLDFLVDEDFNVFFLEANAYPDFKQSGEVQGSIISKLFEETIEILSGIDEGGYHEEMGIGKFWKCFSRDNPEKLPFNDLEGR